MPDKPVTDCPPLPVASSARIASEPSAPKFKTEGLPNHKEKPSGSGYSQKPSGSGFDLPAIENLQWESNKFGGWEAWHCPPGAIHRKDKTYLCHLGKRLRGKLEREKSPEEFRAYLVEWIATKRAEKGIE